jgi:ParB-like chromosome segregation protein Spo0J
MTEQIDVRMKPGEAIELTDGPLQLLENQNNLVPALKEQELTALKESIQQEGVQIPIVISLAPTRGRIIDGFNRYEVCKGLGMSFPATFKTYRSVLAEDEAALGLNVKRRQLDDLSAGLINLKLLELHGIVGRGKKSLSGMTISDVAREAGQTERTFYRRVELARLLSRADCVDILEAYRAEEVNNTDALTLGRARKKAADNPGSGLVGQTVAKSGQSLKDVVKGLKHTPKITPLDQARMEAFTEGVKWGFEAVSDKKVDPDWVLQQLTDWRETTLQREQDERDKAEQARQNGQEEKPEAPPEAVGVAPEVLDKLAEALGVDDSPDPGPAALDT